MIAEDKDKSFLAREDVRIKTFTFRYNAYKWYPYFTFHCQDQIFSPLLNHEMGQIHKLWRNIFQSLFNFYCCNYEMWKEF